MGSRRAADGAAAPSEPLADLASAAASSPGAGAVAASPSTASYWGAASRRSAGAARHSEEQPSPAARLPSRQPSPARQVSCEPSPVAAALLPAPLSISGFLASPYSAPLPSSPEAGRDVSRHAPSPPASAGRAPLPSREDLPSPTASDVEEWNALVRGARCAEEEAEKAALEQRVRLLEQSVHRLASMVGRAASPAPVPAPLPLPPARTRRCHRRCWEGDCCHVCGLPPDELRSADFWRDKVVRPALRDRWDGPAWEGDVGPGCQSAPPADAAHGVAGRRGAAAEACQRGALREPISGDAVGRGAASTCGGAAEEGQRSGDAAAGARDRAWEAYLEEAAPSRGRFRWPMDIGQQLRHASARAAAVV